MGNTPELEGFPVSSSDLGTAAAPLEDRILDEARAIVEPDCALAVTRAFHRMTRDSNRLVRRQVESFSLAFGPVVVSVGVLFGPLRILAISTIPNVIPISWIGGSMGLLGIEDPARRGRAALAAPAEVGLLDRSHDRIVLRADITSRGGRHGEVRVVERRPVRVAQTLLYGKLLRRVGGGIRDRERASWPPDVEGPFPSARDEFARARAARTAGIRRRTGGGDAWRQALNPRGMRAPQERARTDTTPASAPSPWPTASCVTRSSPSPSRP